jgi:glucose dehydrogenase
LLLADLTINGRQRKVLMQANKDGFYYVLDRTTGAFISAQPFSQVTWAKGIDQETGRPIINPEAHYDQSKETISISPGPGGAHNWSPMSFNPATGLVYIPTTTSGSFNFTELTDFTYQPGRTNMGIVFGIRGGGPGGGRGGAPETPPPPPPPPATTGKTLPAIGPTAPEGQRGMLVAWDPVTQKERWRTPGGGGIGGGTVTTAGNLIFQVIPDGHLMAYSADKGEKLLETQTGLRGGMGPPITYMLDGRQYVAFMGGTGPVFFGNRGGGPGGGGNGTGGGNAAPPDIAGAQAQRGPGVTVATGPPPLPPVTPKLLVFTLDGKAPLPITPQ